MAQQGGLKLKLKLGPKTSNQAPNPASVAPAPSFAASSGPSAPSGWPVAEPVDGGQKRRREEEMANPEPKRQAINPPSTGGLKLKFKLPGQTSAGAGPAASTGTATGTFLAPAPSTASQLLARQPTAVSFPTTAASTGVAPAGPTKIVIKSKITPASAAQMPGTSATGPSPVGNGMQPYAMQQQPALGFPNQADRAALKAQEKLAKEQEKAAARAEREKAAAIAAQQKQEAAAAARQEKIAQAQQAKAQAQVGNIMSNVFGVQGSKLKIKIKAPVPGSGATGPPIPTGGFSGPPRPGYPPQPLYGAGVAGRGPGGAVGLPPAAAGRGKGKAKGGGRRAAPDPDVLSDDDSLGAGDALASDDSIYMPSSPSDGGPPISSSRRGGRGGGAGRGGGRGGGSFGRPPKKARHDAVNSYGGGAAHHHPGLPPMGQYGGPGMGGGGAAAYKPSVPAGPPVPLPKLMEKVLESLAQQDKFKYFKAPVTDEVAPGYSNVIQQPMCFDDMRAKLRAGSYPTWEPFESDLDLIFSNAMRYNPPENYVHMIAIMLRDVGAKYLEVAKQGSLHVKGAGAQTLKRHQMEIDRQLKMARTNAKLKADLQPVNLRPSAGGILRGMAAQAKDTAYGRGHRNATGVSYAAVEGVSQEPERATRGGGRGRGRGRGAAHISRQYARQMVDPDQRRLAAVYHRKTEADDLREFYHPRAQALGLPATIWNGLAGGTTAEGTDFAVGKPALRAGWPGGVPFRTAKEGLDAAGTGKPAGFEGSGLPQNSYAKSLARFIRRCAPGLRRALVQERLVPVATVEEAEVPFKGLRPPTSMMQLGTVPPPGAAAPAAAPPPAQPPQQAPPAAAALMLGAGAGVNPQHAALLQALAAARGAAAQGVNLGGPADGKPQFTPAQLQAAVAMLQQQQRAQQQQQQAQPQQQQPQQQAQQPPAAAAGLNLAGGPAPISTGAGAARAVAPGLNLGSPGAAGGSRAGAGPGLFLGTSSAAPAPAAQPAGRALTPSQPAAAAAAGVTLQRPPQQAVPQQQQQPRPAMPELPPPTP